MMKFMKLQPCTNPLTVRPNGSHEVYQHELTFVLRLNILLR